MDEVTFKIDLATVRQVCSNLLTYREFLEQLKDALEEIPTREEREQLAYDEAEEQTRREKQERADWYKTKALMVNGDRPMPPFEIKRYKEEP